jgi:hypothetical protein
MGGRAIPNNAWRIDCSSGLKIRLEIPSTERQDQKIISSSVIILPQLCASLLRIEQECQYVIRRYYRSKQQGI